MSELDKLQEYLVNKGYVVKRRDKEPPNKYGARARRRGGERYGYGEIHELSVYREGQDNIWFSASCSWGNCGYKEGLIELICACSIIHPKDPHDSWEGWLTAQEIIDRLEAL